MEQTPSGDPIGRFVFGKSYLARPDAVDLDPVELKLSDRVYETGVMGGVFGAIRDASPDYWGRRLIEYYLKQINVPEIVYLLSSPDDRGGALGFGRELLPPAPKQDFNRTMHLEELQRTADAISANQAISGSKQGQVEKLLALGTSMGGARPKAVVEHKDALWLAKFNTEGDRWNNARVEHAMLKLAFACGLDAAESEVIQVGGRDVLLVKRFDREKTETGYLRHRMVSALTILRVGDDVASRNNWSYVALAEELRRFSANPQNDARELYCRMVFNALISNTDDHPRNHAFVARRQWALSPAYDLTPMPMVSIERRDLAMICGRQGRIANAENLLSECRRFMLDPDAAERIITAMAEKIRGRWRKTALSAGVSGADLERIKGAFVYPGFGADDRGA
jgi:serine/threonine-protein kinase HipA